MPYEIDIPTDGDESHAENEDARGDTADSPADGATKTRAGGAHHDEAAAHAATAGATPDVEDAVGVSIPEDHVGAFVAQAFDDPERDVDWSEVVEAFVPDGARDAWTAMCARSRVVEVLDAAAGYDDRATEALEAVPLSADADPATVAEHVDEALRCRRNADRFRDGVADAYADDVVSDDDLVAAIEASTFDTDAIARRESALEDVDAVHDVDFRPYGGQLFDADAGPDPDVDHDAAETW